MEINLDEFKAPGKTNTRVSKGQTFTGIKYNDKTFTFSNAIFEKLGLATSSLLVRINPATNQVVLVPAADTEGDIFKRTPKTGLIKGKSIVSSVIEVALKNSSLLTTEEGNQYVDIQDATAGGKPVYVIVAGGGTNKVEKAPSVLASTPIEPTVSAPEAPSALPDNEIVLDEVQPEAEDEFDDKF